MGQPHEHDRDPMHGFTVVVETEDSQLFVGKCDRLFDDHIILKNADKMEANDKGSARLQYLQRAQKVGVFPNLPHVVVPLSGECTINKLVDINLD